MAANIILIEGVSGSGKSTSLRNLDPASTYCILPNAKVLPFKGARAKYKVTKDGVQGNLNRTDDFKKIPVILDMLSKKCEHIKTVVIDD